MHLIARILANWMPASAAVKACRETSSDFAAILAARLDESPADGLSAFREAARETGVRAAARLKRELGLGSSFEDVELAWRILSRASGMTITIERGASRSVFKHIRCPVRDAGGEGLCSEFCLPLVEGLTREMCPSCSLELVKPAEGGKGCWKALVKGAAPHE